MAKVQVILHEFIGGTIHEAEDQPVILQFFDDKSYETAEWIIPSYPRTIPAPMLSELRITDGPVKVIIEGPEGFHSGPYQADWVRCGYPRGKLCSFLEMAGGRTTGVTVIVVEESLIVDELVLGSGGGSQSTSSDI